MFTFTSMSPKPGILSWYCANCKQSQNYVHIFFAAFQNTTLEPCRTGDLIYFIISIIPCSLTFEYCLYALAVTSKSCFVVEVFSLETYILQGTSEEIESLKIH